MIRKAAFFIGVLFLISTALPQPFNAADTWTTSPVGFASLNEKGQNGTTGGAGGKIYTIDNADSLYKLLRNLRADKSPSLPATVIQISGVVSASGDKMIYFKDNANITIIGLGTNARFDGFGLEVETSYNIIIRNIEFWNCPVDGIDIRDPETHHIWVDHCNFTDGDTPDPGTGGDANHDGALDIKRACTNVTVSWCHFSNHSKTCLMGHKDGNTEDTVLSVTYHHNWFEKTWQRHPRVRYGRAHVFNNFEDNNKLYGIASTENAKVVVEGNYFLNIPNAIDIGYEDSGPGELVERNNIYSSCGTGAQSAGTAFEPSGVYSYTVDDPSTIPTMLQLYAGSGKVNVTDVKESGSVTPAKFDLKQNYPNPFNPSTKISYQLKNSGYVTLAIYDILGKQIETLVNQNQQSGEYSTLFNAAQYPSGMYVYTLRCGNESVTKKMLLLK
jgi:pectate lyase